MQPNKLIKPRTQLTGIGTVVNRTLRCDFAGCSGILDTPQGPAPVRFAQLQYAHKPAPECPYCSIPMVIESMHDRKSGHISKRDEHKVMDRLQEQVFSQAESTQHKLAENAREGDTAKLNIDPNAARYLEETTRMAQQKNLPTGFGHGGGSVAAQIKRIKGVAADPTFARETAAAGAMMPMSALAASVGNAGMSQNDGTRGIITGGHQFWKTPTSSRKIR